MSKRTPLSQSDSELLVATKTKKKGATKRSSDVILLNDDYTTMEFVVSILESVFGRSPAEATAIMLKVHKSGRGVAGSYSRDVAEAKVAKVHQLARVAGYPLKAIIEER